MNTTNQASPAETTSAPKHDAPPSDNKTSDSGTTAPVAPNEDPPPEADFA